MYARARGIGATCVGGVDPSTGNPCFTATGTDTLPSVDTIRDPITGALYDLKGNLLSGSQALQQQVAAMVNPLYAGGSLSQWLSTHSSYLMIGGAALLALLLFSGGGRRR